MYCYFYTVYNEDDDNKYHHHRVIPSYINVYENITLRKFTCNF